MATILDHALQYAAMGWHVLPCKPRSKVPATEHGHTDATCDAEQIKAWWTQNPNYNVAISLEPSGLVALDIDVGTLTKKDGSSRPKIGQQSYRELVAAFPEVAANTLSYVSGAGDPEYPNLLFQRPEGIPAARKIRFLHHLLPEASRDNDLDLLGKGFIVAAPSIHENGKPYSWAQWVQAMPLPEPLQRAFVAKAPSISPEQAAEGIIADGSRDDSLFRLAAALREMNLSEQAIVVALHQENLLRCDPPKSNESVARIARSAFNSIEPTKDVMTNAGIAKALGLPVGAAEPVVSSASALEPGRISVGLSSLKGRKWPPIRMYSTGMPSLDAALGGGVCTRGLTVMIGPPGSGKSSLAISVCRLSAKPALYISTELETQEIVARIQAQVLKTPWLPILKGLGPADQLAAALDQNPQIRIIGKDILPRGGSTTDLMQAITNEIHYTAQEYGEPPIVIIDYLQDLTRMSDEDRRVAVGAVSNLTRTVTSMLDIPLIALSSTGRGWYGSHAELEHPGMFLASAKETGDIDFDASNVLFLDVIEDDSKGYRNARIAIAKCRHASLSFVGCKYLGAQGGVWEESASALDAFDLSKQESVAQEKSSNSDRDAVLRAVGADRVEPRAVLKYNCGIPTSRADRVIGLLLEEGVLRMTQQVKIVDHKRTTKNVVVLASSEL